ncbi:MULTISPECIES: hypothetical protein [Clostridium]|uniref:Uncharacterized protein n=1 Tax=Clostridium frigoriphilum TaxID=443253 RepID=A0ABU7UPL6_9CLOT|nr:hypothetical protein [Clostridium sp. DSM 17811]MBU3099330.1 hypothetical protein [Clostridium sp. DSM 17811]
MSFNMYVPIMFIFGCGRLSELHEQKLSGKRANPCEMTNKDVVDVLRNSYR